MSNSVSSGAESENAPEHNLVDVSFEINQPKDDYIPGIRQVLTPLAKTLNLDVFELTEAIAAQQNLGNIICLGRSEVSDAEGEDLSDDDDTKIPVKSATGEAEEAVVVGVFTILNAVQHTSVVQPLFAALVKTRNKTFCEYLADEEKLIKVGVLITERFDSSLPDSVCRDVYAECKKDIQWTLDLSPSTLQPEEIAELKFYHFDMLFVIAWGYRELSVQASPRKKHRKASASVDDALIESLIIPSDDIAAMFKHRLAAVAVDAKTLVKAKDGSKLHKYMIIFAMPFSKL